VASIKDKLVQLIRIRPRVLTRAIFWKVPHNNSDDEIHLKIGRYNRPKDWSETETLELDSPKSELTLDGEEFGNLIEFISSNYEPFKDGTRAFLPLDNPFDVQNAEQIKQLLNIEDKKGMLQFLLNNDVIPEELEVGLTHARKLKAIDEFQYLLESDFTENKWQTWFEKNSWVLGSDFVKILDERAIDTSNISDFLMQSYDGFLDVIEIKRPEGGLKFWGSALDHGNYYPHSDLIKAITQSISYIHEIELQANDMKFFERVGKVKTIKPRCTLIFGRSNGWDQAQQEAFRILNSSYHNLTIMTFDHVLERAKRIIGKSC
jgi:hypothetical protein